MFRLGGTIPGVSSRGGSLTLFNDASSACTKSFLINRGMSLSDRRSSRRLMTRILEPNSSRLLPAGMAPFPLSTAARRLLHFLLLRCF